MSEKIQIEPVPMHKGDSHTISKQFREAKKFVGVSLPDQFTVALVSLGGKEYSALEESDLDAFRDRTLFPGESFSVVITNAGPDAMLHGDLEFEGSDIPGLPAPKEPEPLSVIEAIPVTAPEGQGVAKAGANRVSLILTRGQAERILTLCKVQYVPSFSLVDCIRPLEDALR